MKFERINDDKIKIVVTVEDLKERGIKISDLSYGNKETGDLFQEIIQEAIFECEFDVEEKAVLVEAVPISFNTIEVFVTKLGSESVEEELQGRYDLLNKIKDKAINRNRGNQMGQFPPEIENLLNGNGSKNQKSKNNEQKSKVAPQNIKREILVRFRDLDDVCNVAKILINYFKGEDKLLKFEDDYYLILHTSTNIIENMEVKTILNVLREFGEIVTDLSPYFIEEHGKVILEKDVIKNLERV